MICRVVPGLLSLEIDVTIRGAYLWGDINFFEKTSTPEKFHYRVLREDFKVPSTYEFRHAYYFRSQGVWYYERTYLGRSLKFRFDPTAKAVSVNRSVTLVPFQVGGILPFGRHLSDILVLDLILSGYLVIRGCAFAHKGATTAVIAPSFNGKTSLVLQAISRGAEYVAEDALVIDPSNNLRFPTSPAKRNFGRNVNRSVWAKANETSTTEPRELTKVWLARVARSPQTLARPSDRFSDYLLLNSLWDLGNPWMRAYLFAEGLTQRAFESFRKLAEWEMPRVLIGNMELERELL